MRFEFRCREFTPVMAQSHCGLRHSPWDVHGVQAEQILHKPAGIIAVYHTVQGGEAHFPFGIEIISDACNRRHGVSI